MKLLDYTSMLLKFEWKTAQQGFIDSIGMRSYLIKSDFKFNLQKYHFVYVYEVIIKCYLSFITCLYFSLASHEIVATAIKWNYLRAKTVAKKFDSNNNWKTAWPRKILEWHLFLTLSLGFVWKMLNFVWKHLSFYRKDVC